MRKHSISVILPLFSPAKYARMSIASVLGQTQKPHELVLIDDAAEPWIDEEYLSSISNFGLKVRYVRNEVNLGSSTSLNLGMSLAESEILCLLNDDDLFSPNRINQILRSSYSSKEENFWGFSSVTLINDLGVEIKSSGLSNVDQAISESKSNWITFETLECSNSAVSSGNLFLSKKLFESGYRFEESLSHVQDWYLTQRLFLNSEPKVLDNSTYYYRIHEKNTFRKIDSHVTAFECVKIQDEIRNELWTKLSKERILEILSHKVLNQCYRGSTSRNRLTMINYRAYAILGFYLSKLAKRKVIFGLITFVGKRIERHTLR